MPRRPSELVAQQRANGVVFVPPFATWDSCNGGFSNALCGGCDQCLLMQSEHWEARAEAHALEEQCRQAKLDEQDISFHHRMLLRLRRYSQSLVVEEMSDEALATLIRKAANE